MRRHGRKAQVGYLTDPRRKRGGPRDPIKQPTQGLVGKLAALGTPLSWRELFSHFIKLLLLLPPYLSLLFILDIQFFVLYDHQLPHHKGTKLQT